MTDGCERLILVVGSTRCFDTLSLVRDIIKDLVAPSLSSRLLFLQAILTFRCNPFFKHFLLDCRKPIKLLILK